MNNLRKRDPDQTVFIRGKQSDAKNKITLIARPLQNREFGEYT